MFGLIRLLLDAGSILLACVLAYRAFGATWSTAATAGVAVAILLFHLIGWQRRLYTSRTLSDEPLETRQALTTWCIAIGIVCLLVFATGTTGHYPRIATLVWFGSALAMLAGWRAAERWLALRYGPWRKEGKRAAVYGATPAAERLCQALERQHSFGMRLIGLYDDREEGRRYAFEKNYAVFAGGSEALLKEAASGRVDVVFVALSVYGGSRLSQLINPLARTGARVYLVADPYVYGLGHARWAWVDGVPLLDTNEAYTGSRWWKRAEDLVLGCLILVLIAPVMFAIAVAIKLSSPGPIFFRQRRYGLNGREIRVLKFRTMRVYEGNAGKAMRDDPRVTSLGAFLRRTSLDELPQFLNVISGEMSIVGPRPHAVAHNEFYRSRIQAYMLCHSVKPGITGWAQVNGWRGETDTLEKMAKRIEHDLEYVHNYSLFWDLKILFMTLFSSHQRNRAS